MTTTFNDILEKAFAVEKTAVGYEFSCSHPPGRVTRYKLPGSVLAKIHKDLPEAVEHFASVGDQKSIEALRLTLAHWCDTEGTVRLKVFHRYMTTPHAVEHSALSPLSLKINTHTYKLKSLPTGTVVADEVEWDTQLMPHKDWFDENYPGAFDRVMTLNAIGCFTPVEAAELAFSTPVVAMKSENISGIVFD